MRTLGAYLLAALIFAGGCSRANPFTDKVNRDAADKKKAAARKKMVHKNLIKQQKQLEDAARGSLHAAESAYRLTQNELRSSTSSGYRSDVNIARQVLEQIKTAAELEPTVAVWIFDTSPSALRVTDELRRAASDFYAGDQFKVIQAGKPEQLLTAIIGYNAAAEFVLDPPSGDKEAIKTAFAAVTSGTEEKEATFATVLAAVKKYLPIRLEERRQLMIVLATDEAGDDPEVADQLVPLLKKHEIPLYVVGLNAPWGVANPSAEIPGAAEKAKLPIYGPESFATERVQIELPGFRAGAGIGPVDSGFGPHALERIARAGSGSFLAVRPGAGASYGGGNVWPTGTEVKFDPPTMKKYAPDYVSAEEYRKLLSENKARAAVHAAAKLPRTTVLKAPPTSFFKRNEADFKKLVTAAQREAAKVSPEIDKLVDILEAGESDRYSLTVPRWEAAYDLAYGRALAAKVRADVYNASLAALARGRNFERPESKTWNLNPDDAVETGSSHQKSADKARKFLQRVVNEHAGTPWAKEAQEDLLTPLGWKLSES